MPRVYIFIKKLVLLLIIRFSVFFFCKLIRNVYEVVLFEIYSGHTVELKYEWLQLGTVNTFELQVCKQRKNLVL